MEKIVKVEIETALQRGEAELTTLTFRRPVAGDLRGLSIGRLGQVDYDEVRKLIPRISMDGLIAEEVDKLDSADMIEVALMLSDFFQTESRKGDFPTG